MKCVINSQEHPIGKVKDFFYKVEFKIRGSCHYLVTTYFFWIENTSQTNQMRNYANWSNDFKLIVTINI